MAQPKNENGARRRRFLELVASSGFAPTQDAKADECRAEDRERGGLGYRLGRGIKLERGCRCIAHCERVPVAQASDIYDAVRSIRDASTGRKGRCAVDLITPDGHKEVSAVFGVDGAPNQAERVTLSYSICNRYGSTPTPGHEILLGGTGAKWRRKPAAGAGK
jgi:hypothetical protein